MTLLNDKALTGQFELTPHCNLNCKMCYIHDNHEAGSCVLPASFWIDMARQAAEAGTLVLSLTGGETLLYPELDMLMDALGKMGFLISFNTNGTLVDEKRVEWFRKYWPNKINISLYGASDATYEKLCGCKDGFSRVSKAIDLLLEAGLNVFLNGILTPYNLQDLRQMHDFANARGLILHVSHYAFPYRNAPGEHTREAHRLAPADAAKAYIQDQKILLGDQKFKQFGAQSLMQIDLRKKGILDSPCETCYGGCKNFQISYDGSLHPCAMLPKISVDLRETELKAGLERVRGGMEELHFPGKCEACEWEDLCPVCKAAVYLETGGCEDAPDYLCRYTEALEGFLREECADVRISLQDRGDLGGRHCEV